MDIIMNYSYLINDDYTDIDDDGDNNDKNKLGA